MTIDKKVSRAICLAENGECRNCDGAIQHFKGLFPDGSAHARDRPCPFLEDAAVNAFLEKAAKRGWHMRPDEATEEMVYRAEGMSDFILPSALGNFHARRLTEMKNAISTANAAAPKFEWLK